MFSSLNSLKFLLQKIKLKKMVLFYLLIVIGLVSYRVHSVPVFDEVAFEIYQDNPHDAAAVMNFLFPSRTSDLDSFNERQLKHRQLAVDKQPYNPNSTVSCAKCSGLKQCKALNTFMIQEKYYPSTSGGDTTVTETCTVIESFGERISKLIFGSGRTFRDTEVCRDIVMQYLCLFYGSDSAMYTNYCVFQETSTDGDQQITKLAPRPPCRTFCVQVASVCANSPNFIQTCLEIACPPTETTCTPNPSVNGSIIDVPLDCYLPTYRNPYVRSSASKILNTNRLKSAALMGIIGLFVYY